MLNLVNKGSINLVDVLIQAKKIRFSCNYFGPKMICGVLHSVGVW